MAMPDKEFQQWLCSVGAADLSQSQWDQVIDLVVRNKLDPEVVALDDPKYLAIFDKVFPLPRYRHGQKVYVACAPRSLSDPTQVPVFMGEIDCIRYMASVDYGSDTDLDIQYGVLVGIDHMWRSQSDIYMSYPDARQAAVDGIERELSSSVKDVERLQKVLADTVAKVSDIAQ